MAKTTKTKKRKLVKKFHKDEPQQIIKKLKSKKTEKPPPPQSDSGSDSDSDSGSGSDSFTKLLEPYTKDQLIDLISTISLKVPPLSQHIRHVADRDVSHRKIFIHGLGWDTSRQAVLSAFESFGDIEDCNVVTDKATGKAKGYGFVLFTTRKSALKALQNPKKKIGNRFASCQLASVGPGVTQAQTQAQEALSRRIYVSNVPFDTDSEKLRQFFSKFGEIETGPIGFDSTTGRSRGFALFVYKTEAGAKKVLEDPHKSFEGHRLNCSKATEPKAKKNPVQPVVQTQPPPPQPTQQQQQLQLQQQQQQQQQQPPPPQGSVLAAVAAAQNMAMFGHHPSLNPMYGGFIANPGAAILANQAQSVLGAYGGAGPGLQAMYPNTQMGPQMGQPNTSRAQGPSGYPSYMWYEISPLNFLILDFAFYACLVLIFANFIVIITKLVVVNFASSDEKVVLSFGLSYSPCHVIKFSEIASVCF